MLENRFFKLKKIAENSVILDHQRVYILPTKRGLGFVTLTFLLFLIAFVYNNNLSYSLAFLLSSFFLISILHGYKAVYGLKVTLMNCYPVFAGEQVMVDLSLSNPLAIKRVNLILSFSQQADLAVNLAENEQKKVMLYKVAVKRGWNEMTKISLSSTYPFGFFKVWSSLLFDKKYLVYPAPALESSAPLYSKGQQVIQNADDFAINSEQGGDYFNGLKSYQKGDSIKHIHWRSYAKGQGLLTKQFEQENAGGNDVWLNFDATVGDNLENRISQLCRWVVDAEKLKVDYGFILSDFSLQPAHGVSHYRQCLEALAVINNPLD